MLHIFGESGNGEDKDENLLQVANILTWILRFFPSFCLGNGLYNVINIEAWEFWEGEPLTVWSEPILLVEVLFLFAEAVVYLILAIYLDTWSTKPRFASIWQNVIFCKWVPALRGSARVEDSTVAETIPDDDDVLAEQARVLEGESNNDTIVVSNLTKVYRNGTVAVNKLSVGIPPGECFGLLGINGAGKTTTLVSEMKMLRSFSYPHA
jgi:ABC-type multidrug transport system fused ATPase/permease subunit